MTSPVNGNLNGRGIERLLRPKSVAVVGASATPGSLGASVIANLERMCFDGDIHLINPNREAIGSRSCLNSVDDLPEGIDVAVLAIPRAAVLDTVKALSRRQVGAAIIRRGLQRAENPVSPTSASWVASPERPD